MVAATGCWAAQVIAAKVQLDISDYGMLRASQAETSEFFVLVFKCSIAVTAGAVADYVMTDFPNNCVHYL